MWLVYVLTAVCHFPLLLRICPAEKLLVVVSGSRAVISPIYSFITLFSLPSFR